MLKSLVISNYALIDELNIEFNSGFSVVTGETGAGKSIIVGALSLIMGLRIDSSVLKDESKKCIVEATFNIEGYNLQSLFSENEIDYDDVTIIRRELLPGGKSRSFINDAPVNLTILKVVAEKLIDIHSQHQNLLLSNPKFQLDVVDFVASNKERVLSFKKVFHELRQLKLKRDRLIESIQKQRDDEDYIRFQVEQLSVAKLIDGEQEELEQESERLSHIEEMKSIFDLLLNNFNKEEGLGVIIKVKESILALRKIAKYIDRGIEYETRLEAALIELKDLSSDFDLINSKLQFDPDRLQQVSERLDLIYSLQKKHHVESVGELISILQNFQDKLTSLQSFGEELASLESEITLMSSELSRLGEIVTKSRSAVFAKIETIIVDQLKQLAIPNAEFKVESKLLEIPNENGFDDIVFLFTANKNGKLGEVSKVASGGEIARVMLCIKALISEAKGLPTILFDEIDTGVSGEVAEKMGSIMSEMSQQLQVISITHLPQIASKGDRHFRVFKVDNEHSTQTSVIELSQQERIFEIAKMLSGKEMTDAALSNAREMLKRSL